MSEPNSPRVDARLQPIKNRIEELLRLDNLAFRRGSVDASDVRLVDMNANNSVRKFIEFLSTTDMKEEANVERYWTRLDKYFLQAKNDLVTLGESLRDDIFKLIEDKNSVSDEIRKLLETQTPPPPPEADVKPLRAGIASIERHIDAARALANDVTTLTGFFSRPSNSTAVFQRVRSVVALYERDGSGMFSFVLRMWIILATSALVLTAGVLVEPAQNLIVKPQLAYLAAFPIIALLVAAYIATRGRNKQVEFYHKALAENLTNLETFPRSENGSANGSTSILSSLVARTDENWADRNRRFNTRAASEDQHQFRFKRRNYSETDGIGDLLLRFTATAIGAALYFVAPEIVVAGARYFSNQSWLISTGDRVFLARSEGRELCALARGRQFFQTPWTIYVRQNDGPGASNVRMVRASDVAEIRQYESAGASPNVRDCETVSDLYRTNVVNQIPSTGFNTYFQFSENKEQPPAGQLDAQPKPPIAPPPASKRYVILPFFTGPVAGDLRNVRGDYDEHAAFTHGFDQSRDFSPDQKRPPELAPIAVAALREAFQRCSDAGAKIEIRASGYASGRRFAGATTEKNDLMNYYLAEGRRAGVLARLGVSNFSPPGFAPKTPGAKVAGLTVAGAAGPAGTSFHFADYASMKADQGEWFKEGVSKANLSRTAEIFARSVVISFDDKSLADCSAARVDTKG